MTTTDQPRAATPAAAPWTVDRALALIGAPSLQAIQDLAPADAKPYIEQALENQRRVEQAVYETAYHEDGQRITPTWDILARNAAIEPAMFMADRAREQQRSQRAWDQRKTCPVLGAVDPTTRKRTAPWTGGPITASDNGYRALLSVWIGAAPDADLDRAAQFLTGLGVIEEQPKRRGGRR